MKLLNNTPLTGVAFCLMLVASATLTQAFEVDQLISLLSSDSQEVRDDTAKELREVFVPPDREKWDELVKRTKVGDGKAILLKRFGLVQIGDITAATTRTIDGDEPAASRDVKNKLGEEEAARTIETDQSSKTETSARGGLAGQREATGFMSGRIVLNAPIPRVPPLKVLPNGQPNFGRFPSDEQRAQVAALMVDIEDQSLRVSEDGGLANAFVYLRKPPKGYVAPQPPGEPAIIEVENFYTMRPRVQIVRVGQPVLFRNAHDHMSNFRFSPTYSDSLNFLLQPGERRSEPYVFSKNEPRPVKVHSDLLSIDAYFLAVDHPFAAITDTDGMYEIRDLPVGEHKLFVWHERVGALPPISVNIEAGEQSEHTLSIPGTEFEEYADKLNAMRKGIGNGDIETVRSLMNLVVAADRDSLKLHILQSPNVAVIELLRTRWNLELNPAQLAVVHGNLAAVKQETASMPAEQIDALQLLHSASFHGHVDVIVELMKHKPNIEKGYYYTSTPLASAAEQGHVKAIAKLIELGADVNFKADYAALQRACIGDQPDAVALLIKHGADVNAARHDAQTALHFAAKNGSVKCVRLLLDAGADPAATNANGDTPLAEAERYQHKEVIQLLRTLRQ